MVHPTEFESVTSAFGGQVILIFIRFLGILEITYRIVFYINILFQLD